MPWLASLSCLPEGRGNKPLSLSGRIWLACIRNQVQSYAVRLFLLAAQHTVHRIAYWPVFAQGYVLCFCQDISSRGLAAWTVHPFT